MKPVHQGSSRQRFWLLTDSLTPDRTDRLTRKRYHAELKKNMEEIESTATLYVLSIKGGYYDELGLITELLTAAKFFSTQQEAIEFRALYDPRHHIDCAILLQLTIFISEL